MTQTVAALRLCYWQRECEGRTWAIEQTRGEWVSITLRDGTAVIEKAVSMKALMQSKDDMLDAEIAKAIGELQTAPAPAPATKAKAAAGSEGNHL